MKVPSNAIDASARTALSWAKVARPVEPPPTRASSGRTINEAAVPVSDEARALAACAGAGTDEQKVAALKQRICDGEYRINPQMLAMRILDSLG
jgi:flagellar biosynthesis anti-sigma factor FlgM